MKFPTPKKALVIVAHQDDETIGCGGTIYKWAKNGCEIDVIFVTDGQTGIDQRDLYDNKSIKGTRMEEAKMAADVLQISQIETLNVPCQRVDDKSQDLFHTLIKKIRLFKPEIILTHSSIDKHRDHKAVSGGLLRKQAGNQRKIFTVSWEKLFKLVTFGVLKLLICTKK